MRNGTEPHNNSDRNQSFDHVFLLVILMLI